MSEAPVDQPYVEEPYVPVEETPVEYFPVKCGRCGVVWKMSTDEVDRGSTQHCPACTARVGP